MAYQRDLREQPTRQGHRVKTLLQTILFISLVVHVTAGGDSKQSGVVPGAPSVPEAQKTLTTLQDRTPASPSQVDQSSNPGAEPAESSSTPSAPARSQVVHSSERSSVLPGSGPSRTPKSPVDLSVCTLVNQTVTISKNDCDSVTVSLTTCAGACISWASPKKRFPYLNYDCRSCQPDWANNLESIKKVEVRQQCHRRGERKLLLPSATRCACRTCYPRWKAKDPSQKLKRPKKDSRR